MFEFSNEWAYMEPINLFSEHTDLLMLLIWRNPKLNVHNISLIIEII
jgi:hypothetical protein